jgi:hypothetical protein
MPAGGANATASAPQRAPGLPWPHRGAGAAGAALATFWLAQHLLTRAPLAPVALALAAAAAVLLLPRLGAVSSIVVLAGLAIVDGRAGGGLVLLAVGVATFALLPGAGALWPVPAGAVVLGVLGLGCAWPAAAGLSRLRPARRAGLAAAGFLWSTAAGALTRAPILWRPARLPAPARWTGSLPIALHRVLTAAVSGPLLPAALIWAIAAIALPLLASRGRPAVRLGLVAVWAGTTVSAVEAVGARPLAGAVAGALLGGLLAGAPSLTQLVRDTRRRSVAASPVP